MLSYRKMSHELKQNIIDYLKDNIDSFKYDVIAELAVIYATKMDDNYKQLFFKYFKEKFFKDLQYLDNENLYKIVWALVKSKQITVNDEGQEWNYVKDAVVAKVKDLDPKTLTNIIVLSTIGKDDIDQEKKRPDLFEVLESEIILKMKSMNLHDLVNLLWSAQ